MNNANGSMKAFPKAATAHDPGADGMTLRDWFAGQVVGAIITMRTSRDDALVAERAYGIADALIAEALKPRNPIASAGHTEDIDPNERWTLAGEGPE